MALKKLCWNYCDAKPQFDWTVMAELTRVQAECASVTWRAFSIPGSLVGKQGELRGEREIGEATHADFFLAVHLVIIIFLVYFVLFSPVSFFFFFSKIKSCPSNFIYVFFLRWWISNYHLQSGFKDNRTITKKTHALVNLYIQNIIIILLAAIFFRIFLSAFFHPHPSSASIRSAFYRHPCQEG